MEKLTRDHSSVIPRSPQTLLWPLLQQLLTTGRAILGNVNSQPLATLEEGSRRLRRRPHRHQLPPRPSVIPRHAPSGPLPSPPTSSRSPLPIENAPAVGPPPLIISENVRRPNVFVESPYLLVKTYATTTIITHLRPSSRTRSRRRWLPCLMHIARASHLALEETPKPLVKTEEVAKAIKEDPRRRVRRHWPSA